MEPLRVRHVTLKDIGPFESLMVEFPDRGGLSLICGDNGIGKTTLLEAITAVFSVGILQKIKRRQGSVAGEIALNYEVAGVSHGAKSTVSHFEPDKLDYVDNSLRAHTPSIIGIRASRDFSYMQQTSISRDPSIQVHQFGERLGSGTSPMEIKSWFSNRYLFRHLTDTNSWTPEMIQNLATAIDLFSLLDPSVKLDRVDVKTFDIIVSTPSGLIPFEYLSSGFRSAYSLLLGILKEIEFRGLNVSAKDFVGVIVIDELDLHLHPVWQQRIGGILKSAFPNAQIIATTHSPHIIQAAQPSEVVALIREVGGDVRVRPVPSSEYGYAGWTIEEVLEDIMGVEDTKTPVFREAMREFDAALDADDAKLVLGARDRLLKMLHPNNSLRKLVEIQASPYIGDLYTDEADA